MSSPTCIVLQISSFFCSVQNTASRVALIGLFSNGHGLAWYDGSPVASDVIQEFSDAPAGASFLVDKGTGVWEASDVGAPSWVCKRGRVDMVF